MPSDIEVDNEPLLKLNTLPPGFSVDEMQFLIACANRQYKPLGDYLEKIFSHEVWRRSQQDAEPGLIEFDWEKPIQFFGESLVVLAMLMRETLTSRQFAFVAELNYYMAIRVKLHLVDKI